MKQVINGKVYNTETAIRLFEVSNCFSCSDFRHFDFHVYQTKKGAFFLAGSGGPMTMFGRPCGNMTSGGSKIIPLTENEALEWAESQHADISPNEIEKIFNVQEAQPLKIIMSNTYAKIGWQTKRIARLEDSLSELLDLFREAHDVSIRLDGDQHEDDCSYCATINRAAKVLDER